MIKKLLFTMVLIIMCQFTNAQFALGDIAFTAYGCETAANTPAGPVDAFTIVILRDVMVGESITFDENGWFVHLGGLRTGENSCTLVFGTAYPAGTQIVISAVPFEAKDQDGMSAGTLTGSGLVLATGGDSVLAYNTGLVPTTADESSFIAALNMTGPWRTPDGGDSTTTSEKPSVFTDGVNSVSIVPEIDNARVSAANCSNFSDIASLRTMLNTAGNWEVNNTTAYDQSIPICNFVSTLSIENQSTFENEIKLMPNPTNNVFKVVTSNNMRLISVEVLDITGKKVLNIFENTSEKAIDVSVLGAGIYLVKINFENNSIVKKLVKN